LAKRAPSKPNPSTPSGQAAPLSSHVSLASESMKRRISHALASRSAHSGRRVAQVRRCSGSPSSATAFA